MEPGDLSQKYIHFDPSKKTLRIEDAQIFGDWRSALVAAEKFRDSYVAEHRAAEGGDAEYPYVVHRRLGLIRQFNFSRKFQGSLNMAEQLLRGAWRLATAAEIQEEKERQRIASARQTAAGAKGVVVAGQAVSAPRMWRDAAAALGRR